MNAFDWLAGRSTPLALVIFDCDGVLVDSESIANRVVAASLSELGWEMTAQQAENRFIGMTLPDMVPLIAAHLGYQPPPDWPDLLLERISSALREESVLIPGALEALDGVDALGLPWRIASNSSHAEMRAKFVRTGLIERVCGRVHSFEDVPRGKPAPDLFLSAAAAQGVPPEMCIVVEDSIPGATGAAAAGMGCLGFAPYGDGAGLRATGAVTFPAMSELPSLFAAAPRRRAA